MDDERNQKKESLLDESGLGGHELLKSQLVENKELENIEEEVFYELDAERSINLVGGNGSYQKSIVLGLLIPGIALGLGLMLVPYNSMKPLMECSHEEDGEEFASCSMKEACSGEYKIRIGESSVENWISSFMLVCGNEGKEQILVYLLFAGALVGSLFMSALADKLGRKGILLLSVVVYCLICLKSVFTQQIVSFAIVVFGLGIFLATYFNVALCYLLEFLAVENRLSYASFLNLSFPIAGIIVSFLMNQLQNWKIVIIISGIFCMVLVCYFAYFTESPRYHLAKDQFEEARVALQKLAYCNKGRNYLFTFRNEEVELESSFQEADRIRENGVYNFSEICCRFSSMWPGIFCLIIIAFTCFFTFSGLHLHLRPIFSLPYYDHLFVSAIDVVVILLAATFGEKCGRLKAIGLPLLIASVGCIVIYFLFWLPDLIYAIVIICLREFALLSLSVCFVFVPESFPTRMRSVGVGVVHVFSCIALILAYFLMSFKRDLFFVFGIVGLIGMFSLKMGRETANKELQEDVDEIVDKKKRSLAGKKDKSERGQPLMQMIRKQGLIT